MRSGRQLKGEFRWPRALACAMNRTLLPAEFKVACAVMVFAQYTRSKGRPRGALCKVPGEQTQRHLEPGESVWGAKALAAETNMNERSVRRVLKALAEKLPWMTARLWSGFGKGRGRYSGVHVKVDFDGAVEWASKGIPPDKLSADKMSADKTPAGNLSQNPGQSVQPPADKLSDIRRRTTPQNEEARRCRQNASPRPRARKSKRKGDRSDTAGSPTGRDETATAAPEGGTIDVESAKKAYEERTRDWNRSAFRAWPKLLAIVNARLHGTYDQARDCLAHVHDCTRPQELLKRLKAPKYDASDGGLAWAKSVLNGVQHAAAAT